MTQELLRINKLEMHFPGRRTGFGRRGPSVRAVDGVDLSIAAGSTLGLVGESGCGKSTLGRCVVRAYRPTAGEIHYREPDGSDVDLASLRDRALRPYRAKLRMIFQDPFASLNPRMRLVDIVGEPLRVFGRATGPALENRVRELLQRVGLRSEYLYRYPNTFSGGERQRIGIARALALDPRLVVADEAVSALDVSVRAQVLELLRELQEESSLTYLFISHDLGVVEYMADRVAVMYSGRVVEVAETRSLYDRPLHPYTEALLSAVPDPDPAMRHRKDRIVLRGEVADPTSRPPGCPFHPRCPYAQQRCRTEVPALRPVAAERWSACHFAEELDLKGVPDVVAGSPSGG